MIGRLQRQLADLYGVDASHDVRDFLITDPALARALGGTTLLPDTEETVLLTEEDDGIALSIFLDQEMLDRLDSADPLRRLQAEQLADLCTVLEGISHFNYLIWCAGLDRSVTLLELEMQAEVDKFVATHMLMMEQGERELVSKLHSWLFDSVRFRAEMEPEQLERYRAANGYASRFCHKLHEPLVDGNDEVIDELRAFYRLSQQGKISHIHTRTLSNV